MRIIHDEDIRRAADERGRVYLCGNLRRENALRHIPTDAYEIGLSQYDRYTFEKPHYHAFNTEYNFVLEGELKILLLNEKKEYHLKKGDLFVLFPNEPYVGKSACGTRVIFSKVPGGDDKVVVETDDAVRAWGSAFDAIYGG